MDNYDKYHYEFGIHSNIPACCVDYFIKEFQHKGLDYRANYIKVVSLHRKWHYIPCPECHTLNYKILIHECTTVCIPFLRSIGVSEACIKEKIAYTFRLLVKKEEKRYARKRIKAVGSGFRQVSF